MITLLLPVCVVAVVLARPTTPATAPDRTLMKISEAVRLRLAAALLDLGNYLMLSAEERRAFRLRKTLSSARARRLGVAAETLKAGTRRLDAVILEIPIGERAQEGNPKRTLALSCVVYGTPVCGAGDRPEDIPFLFWRVANRPSPGHRGPSVTVDVPDLDRALIAYYARPLRFASGATGFGDLSGHEVATSPTNAKLAYFSYYSGGFRVAKIEGGELNEVGHYIDQGGNNFWGVQVFSDAGKEYVAASDRDYGLYIFRYTGS